MDKAELEKVLDGKKASDIFYEFSEPVIRLLEAAGKLDDVEAQNEVLYVPWYVWNAVVMAELGDDTLMGKYREMEENLPEEFGPNAEEIFALKRGPFAKYKFLYQDIEVYATDEGLALAVSVCSPTELKKGSSQRADITSPIRLCADPIMTDVCMGKKSWNEAIDDLMQDGYDAKEEKDENRACDLWWKTWVALKANLPPNATTIHEASSLLKGVQNIFNWCQDFEELLESTTQDNKALIPIAINFFSEFIEQFPGGDTYIIARFKQQLSRVHALNGEIPLAIKMMETMIKDEPRSSAGHCGLAEVLAFHCQKVGLPANYDRALSILLKAKKNVHKNERGSVDALHQRITSEANSAGQLNRQSTQRTEDHRVYQKGTM